MTDPTARPILFACIPDSGHLNSTAMIAGELARRGVPDVYFASDENRRSAIGELAAKSGVTFVSTGDPNPNATAATWDDDTYHAVAYGSRWNSYAALFGKSFDPDAHIDKYRRLDAEVGRIKPALMVIESITFYAIDIAMTRCIPFVLSVPFMPSNVMHPLLPRGFPAPNSGLPLKMTWSQQITNQLFQLRMITLPLRREVGGKVLRYVKNRKKFGISPDAVKARARIEAAELILSYSVFGLEYPFDAPAKLKLVGALVPPLPQATGDEDLSRWLSANESVVYMGFGTITRLTREHIGVLVDVARRLDGRHSVLWKLPKQQQTMLPPDEEIPGNLRIEDWLPSQLDVLAHPNVKAFFTHVGANSFHEGVYFGKPLVARPLWMDCHDLAVRTADSGVGLVVDHPRTFDGDDILDKLTRVLTEKSFTERAEHFGELQRAAGGVRAAADHILASPALR
jgi:polyene glycosyltransferase